MSALRTSKLHPRVGTRPRAGLVRPLAGTSYTGDSLHSYLQEIGQRDLLDRSDEVSLAQTIREGTEARELLARDGKLSAKRRRELERAVEASEEAKRHFLESNLRLVVSIAKHYQGRGVDLADLVQEGNIGLMRAVERFDDRRGFKFSTYASWWIRQAVSRCAASCGTTVRLPVHLAEQARSLVGLGERLEKELHRAPTLAELALEADIPVAQVSSILQASRQTVSLSSPVGDGDDELEDSVADTDADPEGTATGHVLLGELRGLIGKDLSPAQVRVLTMRYGLDGSEPLSLTQVARTMSLSCQRVRQIESRALAVLRCRVEMPEAI